MKNMNMNLVRERDKHCLEQHFLTMSMFVFCAPVSFVSMCQHTQLQILLGFLKNHLKSINFGSGIVIQQIYFPGKLAILGQEISHMVPSL